MSGPILVTCATGRQGSAVVRALLTLARPPTAILAVTRTPTSSASQRLVALAPSRITLVQGTLDDVPALFDAAERAAGNQRMWGVFSVQLPQGMNIPNETEQGTAVVDESVARGVRHLVYSSVDRGGNDESWSSPTDVPHFASKHAVELHLRDQARDTNMGWTILRPVAFMDNLEDGMQTRVFLAALKISVAASKPMQWIAVRDIGVFAAKAFETPAKFDQKAIGLAGDELTLDQLSQTFEEATGKALTPSLRMFGHALRYFVAELRLMIDWFGREGYGVDIASVKETHPGLMNLKSWIVEESTFVKRD